MLKLRKTFRNIISSIPGSIQLKHVVLICSVLSCAGAILIPFVINYHLKKLELLYANSPETLLLLSQIHRQCTASGVFVGVGAVLFFRFFWVFSVKHLDLLLEAAKELKKGNLSHRVNLPGNFQTAKLARAFNEIAASVAAQNEKMKEVSRLKSDFVSTVSHELRTPLTAIKGSLGLILGNVTGPITEETERILRITMKNTDRLIRLISEILDVAKIEAGAIRLHYEKHSITDVITSAIQSMEHYAQNRNIQIVWKKPEQSPLVVFDRDRIVQVLTNLLSNAIKFTEGDGTVTVHCQLETNRVVISVTDTGIGISEEFLERIFEKFQQAHGANHKEYEGTGLGLTIAKAIVEEHEGNLWVNSVPSQGSCFLFSLPWNGIEFAETKKAA